jgi:hypothetical protein
MVFLLILKFKLNPDLTLDDSFNVGTGFDEILYTGSSIIEQADGKIIATGTLHTKELLK